MIKLLIMSVSIYCLYYIDSTFPPDRLDQKSEVSGGYFVDTTVTTLITRTGPSR